MENKCHHYKKKKLSFLTLLLLFCAIASLSVQAQNFTHKWVGGTGEWAANANWVQLTNTARSTVAGSSTSQLVFAGDITATNGDYINGGAGNIPGNKITNATYNGTNTTVTLLRPLTSAPASGVTFNFQKENLSGHTFPNAATISTIPTVVLIDSGVCTVSLASRTIASIYVGNTPTTQGQLVINDTFSLNAINGGIHVRGGIITNNGTLAGTATAATTPTLTIGNAIEPVTIGDWGVLGIGRLILTNSVNGNNPSAASAFINISQTTSTIVPKIIINAGSTANLNIATSSAGATGNGGPYGMIAIADSAKARIQGAGFTGPPTCPLFRTVDANAVLDIDAGVTLRSVFPNTSGTILGTINNAGTLINAGLIHSNGTINNTGKFILESAQLNSFLIGQSVTNLAAIAVGAIYKIAGSPVEYTVAGYGRAASANINQKILMTAATRIAPAADAVFDKFSGTGPDTITSTAAVVQSGNGYLTVNNAKVINVTQERYLSSNQRGWRMLSNPLSNTTFGAVATNSTTPITLGNNTCITFDAVNGAWINASIDGTENWTSKTAASLFIRGRASEVTGGTYSVDPPSNVTLSITGSTTNAEPATDVITTAGNYYLVANPYTAPVSLSYIFNNAVASAGLSTTISYYDPTVGSNGTTDLTTKKGGYVTPTISGGVGSANDVLIPPMGSVFVRATSNGKYKVVRAAIFTGSSTQTGTYNHKTAQTVIAPTNDLKLQVISGNTYYDAVALRFKAIGDAGTNIDFGKLSNTVLDAYSYAGNNKMAVSELELKAQFIPMGINTTNQTNYAFKVLENTIPEGYEAILIDYFLNKSTLLTVGMIYNFTIDSNPASQGESRFAINLKTADNLSLQNQALDAKVRVWPNPASGKINISTDQNDGEVDLQISTINGKVVHEQKSNSGNTTTIQTNKWAKGVYILKASCKEHHTSKKLIVQ